MTVTQANALMPPNAAKAAIVNRPLGRFVLENVSWEFYSETLRQLDRAGQHARVTYDRGRMEIMTVGRIHEIIKKAIGRLIEVYADEAGIGIEGVGNVICRREDLARGLEPDECYYVTSEYRGTDNSLDLKNNPPPDLAVEVEVSTGVGARETIYAELGIPELWRFDGTRVVVMRLNAGTYGAVERSHFFPLLDVTEFGEFVVRAIANQRTTVPEYRTLLRSRKGKSTP